MAITKITYADKESIQNNPTILEKNKVTEDDMNEIKEVVNNNADELESLEEQVKTISGVVGESGEPINILTLLQLVFPVGSTYTESNNINPSETLGFGTWERLKGKVVVGLDEDDSDFNITGQTGGEKTHTLTTEEIPSHTHNVPGTGASGAGYTSMNTTSYDSDRSLATTSAGGGQAHNNLQPYYVTGYMWIRKS